MCSSFHFAQEISNDTAPPTHDRGYAGSQSLGEYSENLCPTSRTVCASFPSLTRRLGSRGYSRLPSLSDDREAVKARIDQDCHGGAAISLRRDATQGLAPGGSPAAPEETSDITNRLESRRSAAVPGLYLKPQTQDDSDHLLRGGATHIRGGKSEAHSYRQPAHGDPR